MGKEKHSANDGKLEQENGEKEEDEEEEEEEIEQVRKDSDDEEIKFGEQLQDDFINSFCDKLQAVCPRKIEGLLAIQFLMVSEVEELRKHVSGKKEVLQVLYDTTRTHYVLVHFDPKLKQVAVYDSLQQFNDNGTVCLIPGISQQIVQLFGHVYGSQIAISIDKEYERQNDNFSCGYRCIGALVDLARRRDPAKYSYSRRACVKLIKEIISETKPTWQMFENAQLTRSKQWTGLARIITFTPNILRTASKSSSSTSTGSIFGNRAPGGHEEEDLEFRQKEEDEVEQFPMAYSSIRSIFLSMYHNNQFTWRTLLRNKTTGKLE